MHPFLLSLLLVLLIHADRLLGLLRAESLLANGPMSSHDLRRLLLTGKEEASANTAKYDGNAEHLGFLTLGDPSIRDH